MYTLPPHHHQTPVTKPTPTNTHNNVHPQDDYLAILEAKRVAANPGLLPCPTPGCLGGLSKALVQAAKAAKAAAADEGEGEWDREEEEQPVVCPKCGVGHVGLGDKTEADEELDRLAAG